MKTLAAFWLGVSCFWLMTSCGNDPLRVDVSTIEAGPVKIQRFDRDFFSLKADGIEMQLEELQKKYPGFAELFIKNVMCPGGLNDSNCIPEIVRFIIDEDMRGAYDACQSQFDNLSLLEKEMEDMFRHHKYYFPQKTIPRVYSMMSGFNYSIATADSAFAVGLEMYLGPGNKFYKMLQVPSYLQFSMQKEFIPADLARAWAMKEFPKQDKSGTLLSEMIYQGKILYFTDALLPETADSLKIRFTERQLEWCESHEADIWAYLIKNELLYSTKLDEIAKFTNEAPFTAGFVKESPGRTGVWLGWKIVRKFMKENPRTTLEQLMNEHDTQLILSKSKYKPG